MEYGISASKPWLNSGQIRQIWKWIQDLRGVCKQKDDWMGGKEAKMEAWVGRQAVHMKPGWQGWKPGWQGWKPGWQGRELGTKETNGSAREQGCSTAALPLFGLQSLALLKKSLYTALQLAVLSSYNVNYALLFSFLSTWCKSRFVNYAEIFENWLSETTCLSRNICPAKHIEKHFGEDVFIFFSWAEHVISSEFT